MSSLLTGPTIRVVDVNGGYGHAVPPMLLTPYSALTVPAYKRAMAFLSENLASFPRSVRKDGAKPTEGHRLDKMLNRRPNSLQNAFVFWRTIYFHAAHTGNGYARIQRHEITSEPVALHTLLPEDICPVRWEPGDGSPTLQLYYHKPTRTPLLGVDVLHLQGLGHDGMAAMDPVALHESTLQRAATIERFQTQFLRNGTIIRGSLEIPGSITKEQREQIKAVLRTFRAGTGNEDGDDILILTDGGKLNNATTSPQQAQLVEQGAASTKSIAQITGVPPEFLFELTEAKYNQSVEQAGQNVVRYTFRPWIEMAEDELTLKLLSEAEQDAGFTIRINPDALLRGDTKTQADTITAKVNAGLMTRNEGRALLELPPDPDPDSDKLKTLGDTAPQPAAGARQSATRPQVDAFSAVAPMLAAAHERLDRRADNAFEKDAAHKKGHERTIWSNVFAEDQKRAAIAALAPIAATIAKLGGAPLDVDHLADRYATAVRRRAATGEKTNVADLANCSGATDGQ